MAIKSNIGQHDMTIFLFGVLDSGHTVTSTIPKDCIIITLDYVQLHFECDTNQKSHFHNYDMKSKLISLIPCHIE